MLRSKLKEPIGNFKNVAIDYLFIAFFIFSTLDSCEVSTDAPGKCLETCCPSVHSITAFIWQISLLLKIIKH